jgi:hypothetical protein
MRIMEYLSKNWGLIKQSFGLRNWLYHQRIGNRQKFNRIFYEADKSLTLFHGLESIISIKYHFSKLV